MNNKYVSMDMKKKRISVFKTRHPPWQSYWFQTPFSLGKTTCWRRDAVLAHKPLLLLKTARKPGSLPLIYRKNQLMKQGREWSRKDFKMYVFSRGIFSTFRLHQNFLIMFLYALFLNTLKSQWTP